MYTMTLNDGTKIEGLILSRNILWSNSPVTKDMLKGKLSPVSITGTKDNADDDDWGGVIGEHEHMEICYVKKVDGKYAIALADTPHNEYQLEKNKADIAFLAMMADVEL